MKFRIVMEDYDKFEQKTLEIEATNVFDAINKAAEMVDNPDMVYLESAEPII